MNDLLERALMGMREMQLSESPPSRIVASTIGVLQSVEKEDLSKLARRRTLSVTGWRWIMRHPVSTVAATVVLILAVGGVALWLTVGGATPALADFLAPLLDAKTLKFKIASEERQITVTGVGLVMAPNRMRVEQSQVIKTGKTGKQTLKIVNIIDADQGKSLLLVPAYKSATLTTWKNTPKKKAAKVIFLELRSLLRDARELPDWSCQPLGEKEIDGRRLVGYRLTGNGMFLDLWGDPKTGMPIRIACTSPESPSERPIIFSDFVFDAVLDESLFSLKAPPGYHVDYQTMDMTPAEEKDLIETFRRYGELCGGTLPDKLDGDLNPMGKRFREEWSKSHPPKATGSSKGSGRKERRPPLEERMKLTHGMSFVFDQLPPEADAHYAGKGVKLGAADRPIFWYHPKGAKNYRVIYADLSVREAAAAPSVPNAQPIASASGPKK